MKRILTTLCVLALFAVGVTPALAAETSLPSCYYPISVEEYTYGPLDEPRINKVYQISLSNDPSLIPTDDFERGGRRYYLLDLIRQAEVGVDIQPCTETVTLASDTNKMDDILQRLDAEMEVTTEDGYTGVLRLDHTSVQVTVDGYKTSTKNLSATRTYPSLSDADVSLIPKTVTDNGNTLTLADVQWANDGIFFTATATYTGTSTSRYATGYTITANYTGEAAKTNCEVVIYTVIFGSVELPEESDSPEGTDAPKETDTPEEPDTSEEPKEPMESISPDDTTVSSVSLAGLKTPLMIGGAIFIAAVGGFFIFKKLRR